ncbi:MAG: hypothetical protein EBZ78_01115 [Verrucomicrobia bacterium]|nr:hypothetical protein [Verrucomicrobiota bacterium]
MIRILLSERIRKTAARLSPELGDRVSRAIADVGAAFGNPHRHHGLGLRKLADDPTKSAFTFNGGWCFFTRKMS